MLSDLGRLIRSMDDLLSALLDALDVVGQSHEEIYDTVCREKMGEAIVHLFIKPDADYVVPHEFGLHEATANLAVKNALVAYATAAKTAAADLGVNSFRERLAAFQNGDVESRIEGNDFDDFFGWMNPTDFDESGNVLEDHLGG